MLNQTIGCGILFTCNGECEFKRVHPKEPDYYSCKFRLFNWNGYGIDYCSCEEAHQTLLKSLTQKDI